jgi:hypothetical protein
MSVTLEEIWNSPEDELNRILHSKGLSLDNILEKRIQVAKIYQSYGYFSPNVSKLLTVQKFIDLISTPGVSIKDAMDQINMTLEKIWSFDEDLINTELLKEYTQEEVSLMSLPLKKMNIAKLYHKYHMLDPKDAKFLSFPEFKTLIERFPLRDVKSKLSLNVDLSGALNEIHLSSIGASFLESNSVELVKKVKISLTIRELLEYKIGKVISQNPEFSNIGLIGIRVNGLNRSANLEKVQLFYKIFDVITVLSKTFSNISKVYGKIELQKLLHPGGLLIIFKNVNVFYLIDALEYLENNKILGGIDNILTTQLRDLEWHLYTDPVTYEDKYLMIANIEN